MVRRKAAGTLRVTAIGRAAHSGSAPDQGRNALLGLAHTATALAGHHNPSGADHLSVVPTVIRSGDAFNVVPAAGELLFDMRADGLEAFEAVLGAVPAELEGVRLEARMERKWPGMNAIESTRGLLERAGRAAGAPDRRRRPRRRQRRQPLRRRASRSRSTVSALAAAARTRRRSSCSTVRCTSAPRWRSRSPPRRWAPLLGPKSPAYE